MQVARDIFNNTSDKFCNKLTKAHLEAAAYYYNIDPNAKKATLCRNMITKARQCKRNNIPFEQCTHGVADELADELADDLDTTLVIESSESELDSQFESDTTDDEDDEEEEHKGDSDVVTLETIALQPITTTLNTFEDFTTQINFLTYVKSQLPDCTTLKYNADILQRVLYFLSTNTTQLASASDVYNHQIIQCYVRDILASSTNKALKEKHDAFPILTNEINKHMRIHSFSDGSAAFGQAFKLYPRTGPTTDTAWGVMKLIKEKATPYAELLHEITIGLVLNTCRFQGAKFAYTYGGFICDKDQSGSENSGDIQCKSKDASAMTILSIQEFISGQSMTKLLDYWFRTQSIDSKTMFKHISDILLQVAHSLSIAQTMYQYMHYDLHLENVIIKQVSPPIDIAIGSTFLQNVSYVPYIIDYGMNVLTFQKQTICSLQNPNYDSLYAMGSCKYKSSSTSTSASSSKEEYPPYYAPLWDIFKYSTITLFDLTRKIHQYGFVIKNKYDSVVSDLRRCTMPIMKDAIKQAKAKKIDNLHESHYEIWKTLTGSKTKASLEELYMNNVDYLTSGLKAEIAIFKQFTAKDWIKSFAKHAFKDEE